MGKLTGKTALITGALQGTGEGVTKTFAHHGVNLILLGISPETEKLMDESYGRGHHCTVVVVDVRSPAPVAAAIRRAEEKEGHIDILMNNAGVCRLDNFLDINDDGRDFHIDINIKGVRSTTKVALPEIIARKDGRIVMMSPITGDMVVDPGETAYTLTKAAIVGLTKSLAAEYAQPDIRINAICPGYMRTPMAESIVRQSNPEDPESVLTEMTRAVPIRHLADPLRVGELAVPFTSDESSYLTGTRNVVDDGSTLSEAVSVGI